MKKNQTEKTKKANPITEEELMAIRQNSNYSDSGKAAPDNNLFFEEKSNPLSSKGN